MNASQASVPTTAGIVQVKKPSGPPSIPVGGLFTQAKLNAWESQTWAAAEPSIQRMRIALPQCTTGSSHSEVTAMCISV
jgi:hypothetical protein